MLIEVTYKTKRGAANPDPRMVPIHLEFFETTTIPARQRIIEELMRMDNDVDEKIISITKTERDAEAIRRSGFRVIEISN